MNECMYNSCNSKPDRAAEAELENGKSTPLAKSYTVRAYGEVIEWSAEIIAVV